MLYKLHASILVNSENTNMRATASFQGVKSRM